MSTTMYFGLMYNAFMIQEKYVVVDVIFGPHFEIAQSSFYVCGGRFGGFYIINSVTTFSILWAKKIAIACPTCVFLVISINMILLDIGIYVCLFFPPHAGTTFITTAVYWLTALVFMIMDYTQMPSFLMKYKIQPGKNAPPPTGKVIKVCTQQYTIYITYNSSTKRYSHFTITIMRVGYVRPT